MSYYPQRNSLARRAVANRMTGVEVDPVPFAGTCKGLVGHRLGDGMKPMQVMTTLRLTALGCAIAVLAGCTEPEPGPTAPPTPPSTTASSTPTPTVDPAVTEAETAALAAYSAYWAGVVTSFADPTQTQDPALELNAGHTALTDAQSVLIKYRADGIHMVGEPEFSPVATEVVLGADPTVTVADCIDVSKWQPVFTASGESAVAPGQSTQVSYQSTVVKLEDRWLVWTVTVDRDTPC